VNSRKLKAIIRISASVGATQPSRCRPRRSKDCMRTTSSWPPRSTAYSLARPRGERVLLALQFAPLFRSLYPLARGCRAPRRIMPALEATAPIPFWCYRVLAGAAELGGWRRQHPDRRSMVMIRLSSISVLNARAL